MKELRIMCLGHSIADGWSASNADKTFQWLNYQALKNMMGAGVNVRLLEGPHSHGGKVGTAWDCYDRIFNKLMPDVVFLRIGENDINITYPTSIAAAMSVNQEYVNFTDNPVSNIFCLGDPTTADGYEWIFAGRSASGNIHQGVRRGLFGTRARNWPSGTPILSVNTGANAAWLQGYEKLLKSILGNDPGRPHPIVICSDQWFSKSTEGALVKALVETYAAKGYKVGFASYTDSAGHRFDDNTYYPGSVGPTSTTTTSLPNDTNNVDVTLATGTSDLWAYDSTVDRGDILAAHVVATPVGSSAYSTSGTNGIEFMEVKGRGSSTTLTLKRNRLSNNGYLLVTTGQTVKLSKIAWAAINPFVPRSFNQNAETFRYMVCQYDSHPTDVGHALMSKADMTAFEALAGMI